MVFDKNVSDVYASFDGLAKLKVQAKKDSPAALENVAKQFEALFLQMMLKNMREAGPGDGLFDSDSSLFYRDMHDKQLALNLSQDSKIGLADMIVKQLGGKEQQNEIQLNGKQLDDYRHQALYSTHKAPPKVQSSSVPEKTGHGTVPSREAGGSKSAMGFVNDMIPIARRAARELGVHPGILVAQAALESGWGQRLIHRSDGRSSHNLFGIKADRRWDGEVASVKTVEFRQGVARKERANFRAYQDFSDSFGDYVRFIKSNPRYQSALAHASDPQRYMQELQKAGYATDPSYADKVLKIFNQNGLQDLSNGYLNSSLGIDKLNSIL